MRVLMLSKALVVGEYQSKAERMACRPDVDLTVVVPPAWRDERGELRLECAQARGYRLLVAPVRLNGHFHTHFYPTIGSIIAQVNPDIIHVDEEPYNFATWHAFRAAHRAAPLAHLIFFTWQNIKRRLLPPFSWMEQDVFRKASLAIVGSSSAWEVLREKGFKGTGTVIPQFGVDESKFSPAARAVGVNRLVVGMAGRLVTEKGAHILLRALASIQDDWELQIIGSGPEEARLRTLAESLGIAARVRFIPWKPSAEMADFYRGLDILVTPSLTRPNWKEQFGRVLIEAMACGIPVIGSNSGEIPNVIEDAGLIVPEGDVEALADTLRSLGNPARRAELGINARRRVLENYTQDRIAALTVDAYRSLL